MDDVILKAWAELSALALKLNDRDKFPVFLDMSGHVESFVLRVGHYADVTYLQLPIDTESGILSSQLVFNVSNIKAAKNWLTERHSDIAANEA